MIRKQFSFKTLFLLKFLIALLFLQANVVFVSAQGSKAKKPATASERLWMQQVITQWDDACAQLLKIKAKPLPWIIFYDSVAAWHLNPDLKLLPLHTVSAERIAFSGSKYALYRVPHTGNMWVPEREAIAISSRPAAAMPYANNKKSFFVAPLPSLYHKLAPADQAKYLDFLFLGLCLHELTHTKQLNYALPQILAVQSKYKMSGSIDDNMVENTFSKNEDYVKIFLEERKHLWNAVLTNNRDSCLAELSVALALAKQRRTKFFVGDFAPFDELDDSFLALEGSAMWVQFQVMKKNPPNKQTEYQTLGWLVERTNSWSQEEGLAMFLIIDKLVPDWKSGFFERELPSPWKILEEVVEQSKK